MVVLTAAVLLLAWHGWPSCGVCGRSVYGEIKGASRIGAWLVAALLLLAGASSLGYFGSQA